MSQIKDLIPQTIVKKVTRFSNFKESSQIFKNLNNALNTSFHKSKKIQMKNGRIHKIYVQLPDVIAVKYELVSLNLSSFHVANPDGSTSIKTLKIGKDKCEEINGKYYVWAKPIISRGKLYLFFKKKYIPAKYIFGESINRTH